MFCPERMLFKKHRRSQRRRTYHSNFNQMLPEGLEKKKLKEKNTIIK